jgi:hypothetical protein
MDANLLHLIRRTVLMVAVILVSACTSGVASTPSPSPSAVAAPPSPTAVPVPTPEPSASPSTSATGTFATDSFAVTISDDLRVRSRPEVSEASKQFTPLLPLGTRLFVAAGPVKGSGFDWYLVVPKGDGLPAGWVAAGRVDDPWIGTTAVACPADPTRASELGGQIHDDPLLALTCLGGSTFTFDALLGSYEAQCGVEPCCDLVDIRACINDAWLIDPSTRFVFDKELPVVFDGIDPATLPMYTFDAPIRVRASGRLDHPFASGCAPTAEGLDQGVIAELGVLRCRSKFVLTSITPS